MSEIRRGAQKKAPQQEAGLNLSRLYEACRKGPNHQRQTRQLNTEPQSWLHSAQAETPA